MMYLIHQNNRLLRILDNEFKAISFNKKRSITEALYELAQCFPTEIIVWCHKAYMDFINKKHINNIFHHKRILASYTVSDKNYISKQIGFVDQSVFIKVNKEVTYPTWLMSSDIGGIHAEILITVLKDFKKHNNFDYFLNSLAKSAMSQGLFCYSEPHFFISKPKAISHNQISTLELFKFVKSHYKWVWVYLLMLCYLIYLKKLPIIPFVKSLFSNRKSYDLDFNTITLNSSRKVIDKKEIDVIIPTIGRKVYLYDVLKDLSKQTILPKNVIIIEQNPDKNSNTELNFLTDESWPFKINHKFTHQTGVCNARNIGINLVQSEWLFLGDDDNRFEPNLIENIFEEIEKTGSKVGSTVYLKSDEKQTYTKTAQTPVFGGGNSFVKSSVINNVKFNLQYEYNYGEDSDFGMQIRNLGEDIIYFSNIRITHLKAPVGGYRIKVEHPWENEKHMPKPSPTIMLFNLKYLTKQQNQLYKLLLFIKFYKSQSIKNPFKYIASMKRKWQTSLKWADTLKKRNA
ncbi:glycosyltransferase family 2 protein [Flavivirga rizhaonensis]|uniref:Glycosyltransferase family 2 protein n=1 Tax=Flavivirga rizhaonensis TaxID=2559571 RepID=A0A4S1E3A2_9FLAO|nr:glycosyltransferase family A protein [Flavivirga rizhaonensis]TGV04432.1 glycosyltransferase family 2 protein [Flavivirga rizhaonensis]